MTSVGTLTFEVEEQTRTARLTGPPELVERAQRRYAKWGGCGFSVDWGDGVVPATRPTQGTVCNGELVHAYASPGNYVVTVEATHLGAADEVIPDWKSSVTITVR